MAKLLMEMDPDKSARIFPGGAGLSINWGIATAKRKVVGFG